MYLKIRKGSGMIQFGWKSVCLPYTYIHSGGRDRNMRHSRPWLLKERDQLELRNTQPQQANKTKPEPLTNNSAKEDLGYSSVDDRVSSVPRV